MVEKPPVITAWTSEWVMSARYGRMSSGASVCERENPVVLEARPCRDAGLLGREKTLPPGQAQLQGLHLLPRTLPVPQKCSLPRSGSQWEWCPSRPEGSRRSGKRQGHHVHKGSWHPATRSPKQGTARASRTQVASGSTHRPGSNVSPGAWLCQEDVQEKGVLRLF